MPMHESVSDMEYQSESQIPRSVNDATYNKVPNAQNCEWLDMSRSTVFPAGPK